MLAVGNTDEDAKEYKIYSVAVIQWDLKNEVLYPRRHIIIHQKCIAELRVTKVAQHSNFKRTTGAPAHA